ncbi:hypothetical protein [Paenibacillus lautus]|nr:hypothetical protein [Paenibacillus lautus]
MEWTVSKNFRWLKQQSNDSSVLPTPFVWTNESLRVVRAWTP